MRGFKPEPVVEPVRVGSRSVCRQLDQRAAARPALLDRPGYHRLTESLATPDGSNPHRFYLTAPGPEPAKARDEGKLKRADDLLARLHHAQELVGISINGDKGSAVRVVSAACCRLAGCAELVVSEQLHDRSHVRRNGAPIR